MKLETGPDAPARKAEPEELLRENERLRGDLLTIARRFSHDLRTPLGGIISSSEFLKEILAENGRAPAALTAPIFESSEAMIQLIERVSFVLKATAQPVASSCVNMGDVVFRVRQHFESALIKKNVALSEPDRWPEAMGVAAWLEAVWKNLVANALAHGNGNIELGWRREEKAIRFWVFDQGDAVPADRRDKLFQRFDSLDDPQAAHGWGLSIVQRLVALQGGLCGYEPRTEGGSCFYFTLPAAKAGG